MTYNESITFLYRLQKFGMKFGLRGIRRLLRCLDHPERDFPSIHIAGTNGKGSTASMIASIFTAAGYKTGLYTSPHLVHFNERIRINGQPISHADVSRLTSLIYPEVHKNSSTFFETVTAVAFKYFSESHVDIAVIETGLGGRLDATNVLHPLVSVITSIGLEHTHILGPAISDIAFEKGGIIKKGIPCITGAAQKNVLRILTNLCRQQKTTLERVQSSQLKLEASTLSSVTIGIHAEPVDLKRVKISLAGKHQAMNALIAVRAVQRAVEGKKFLIREVHIRSGLGNIQKYSGLHARLSVIQRKPLVLADVAHNPDAIRTLCRTLRQFFSKKVIIVFGVMQDKNIKQIAKTLQQITKTAFLVEARTARSCSAEMLLREFQRRKIPAHACGNVQNGLLQSFRHQGKTPVIITGSHFVVGEALAFLKKEKYLTINQ